MAKIFLVNVGANTADQNRARSPIFPDGSFIYVPFPDSGCRRPYLPEAHPYVADAANLRTHLDPDWQNLTYGDNCFNARARALLKAQIGDVLLFWGLLWRVTDHKNDIWASTAKTWCLIGAMRIEAILESSQTITQLSKSQQQRVLENEHMNGDRVEGRRLVRVFIADREHSCRFDRAVELEIYRDDGLLHRTITAKDGRALQWNRPPRWNSALRSCRAVFDLSDADQRKRAIELSRHVKSCNGGYDMLARLIDA